MNRIHEVYEHSVLITPQEMPGADNVQSGFVLADGIHDLLLIGVADALADTEYIKMEVFQADNGNGDNPAEITAAETTLTAGAAGLTNAKVMVSLNTSALSQPYISVKLSTNATVQPVVTAEMIAEASYRGSLVNDDATLTVV